MTVPQILDVDNSNDKGAVFMLQQQLPFFCLYADLLSVDYKLIYIIMYFGIEVSQ